MPRRNQRHRPRRRSDEPPEAQPEDPSYDQLAARLVQAGKVSPLVLDNPHRYTHTNQENHR